MRRGIALGGFVNVTLWLAWLWLDKTLVLRSEDVIVTSLEFSCSRDLFSFAGMLEYILLPETKIDRTSRVDVIVATATTSGLRPLQWVRRV